MKSNKISSGWNLHKGDSPCTYCKVTPNHYHLDSCPSRNPYGIVSDSISPDHYKFKLEGKELQAIDIIKATVKDFSSYCEGNVLKYMLRYHKKNGVEDLKKAAVYLSWLIENEDS